jgi:hypothetical protein
MKSNALRCVLLCVTIVLSSGLAKGNEPITIGVSLGLTGRYSAMALQQEHGFELWQKDVNRSGDILGKQVQLLIRDDKSDPEIAKKLYPFSCIPAIPKHKPGLSRWRATGRNVPGPARKISPCPWTPG